MSDARWKIRIDACRPHSDDISSPEMTGLADALREDESVRAWYERTQSADAEIAEAFADVPVPEGLEQRIWSQVEPATVVQPASGGGLSDDASAQRPAMRSRWSRRYLLAAATTVVAALAVAVLVTGPRRNPINASESFALEVIGWTAQADQLSWLNDFADPQVESHPFDSSVRFGPERWAVMTTVYGDCVVYDIASRRGTSALLFCIDSAASGSNLESAPPASAFSTTGGVAVGLWHRDGITYVLAVRGGQQRYEDFVQKRLVAQSGWAADQRRVAARLEFVRGG